MHSGQDRARHLARGTLSVMAAEALALPVALLLAAFVTRRLGPSGYGLFALASSLVAWVEWTSSAVLSRAVIREASARPDDPHLGTTAIQLNVLIGVAAACVLWLASPMLAWVTGEPALTRPLRLLCWDIPLFTTAMAHRSLLVGSGAFKARAILPAVRWTGRLAIVITLVSLGWSVEGVIIGTLAASAAEVAVARLWMHPPLIGASRDIWRALIADALPFLALSITLRLFDRIDLLLFKVLGGTTAQAGLYGAAQSLGWALSVVSVAFPPLLLATLTRLYTAGDAANAARLAGQSLRMVGWLLPIAGIAAGAGVPLAALLFGSAFAGAGPLLGPLLLGGVAQVLMAVVIMTLTAAGYPNAFVRTGVAMVVLATGCGLFAIPAFGAMGAAATTSATGCLGAMSGLWLSHRLAGVPIPLASFARAAAAAAVAGLVCYESLSWLPLFGALALGGLTALGVLALSGELGGPELRAAFGVFDARGTRSPVGDAG
jgi:O-antigen/teichoic acid export membrane protein